MRQKRFKAVCGVILTIVLVPAALFLAQRLVTPKYMSGVLEGALPAEYYAETTAHDVIFVGDCEVYENFSPITLWQEYGITSYIRGGAQQLIWHSYYTLEDTFKRESPEVVVFNVLSMKYGEPQNEAYNRMNLDGLRLSRAKLGAVKASVTEEEAPLSYVFPLLRYHSRWSGLEADDVKYLFSRDAVSHSGYLMRADVMPKTKLPSPTALTDYTISPVCFDYLDKMRALCEDNGAELVLIKSPSEYPHWYDEWDAQVESWALENGLTYINMLDLSAEIGIDMSTDTYDGGLHLNLAGAEKLSRWFGAWLRENAGLADHRGDPELDAVYAEKLAAYEAEKAAQEAEIAEHGKLISITRAQ